MFAKGVCNPVCGAEKDEDGICESGTKGGLRAAARVCNLVGGG